MSCNALIQNRAPRWDLVLVVQTLWFHGTPYTSDNHEVGDHQDSVQFNSAFKGLITGIKNMNPVYRNSDKIDSVP